MKYLRFICLSLGLGLASAANAGWGTTTTITGYYVEATGSLKFTTANNQNPDTCTTSHWLTLDATATNFKLIVATVMAAHAAGSTVTLFYEGCSGGYPLISTVAVPNSW